MKYDFQKQPKESYLLGFSNMAIVPDENRRLSNWQLSHMSRS